MWTYHQHKVDLSQLREQYHTTVKTLLDKNAPVRSKSIKIKPAATWMSPEIINDKGRHRITHLHNYGSVHTQSPSLYLFLINEPI